jgi:NADPH-dependent 2,4-dienoyl-CoA reductase/sulfur reductase-like enzyme/rhodanese-related sulfurtransferase
MLTSVDSEYIVFYEAAMGKRILIVGGVAGGASAAARLRRLDESAEIVVFERGPHVSFANCGLPYHIGGEIADGKALLVQSPERLKAVFNLDVRTRHEVLTIDRAARTVEVRDLATGSVVREPYDALLLATGAAPLKPPIPGIDRPGHFTLRNIPDMERIIEWANTVPAGGAIVVGAGFIGLEMAEQLHRRGLRVTVVEALPQVLAPLDPEMAASVEQELRGNGVEVRLNAPVVAFADPAGEETVAASVVVLKDGTRLPADLVVLGLGVRPEINLAKAAGLEIGQRGGIRVDDHLRTSDPNIWAVGDAIEVRDPVTGEWTLVALAGPANRQGRIAADNILGGDSVYRGTLGTAIVRVFGLVAAATGASEKTLNRLGIPHEVVHVHPNSHAGYYPGATSLALKLLFAPGDGRLLGAQAVGADGVDKRIDVLATALHGQMTVHDLAELELAYAPPFGAAKDPVNLAGMAAENSLTGKVRVAQWSEVGKGKELILDVREAKEREAGAIPGSRHIPLGELRRRLGELPRDRELLVHCQSGQRSYNACRLLTQNGFRCRNLSGSYKTWKSMQS